MINFIFVISYLFSLTNKSINSNGGYDERFDNEKCDYGKLNKIFNNYKLLKKLESNNSIIYKAKLAKEYLESNNTKGFDINGGGLMNDWKFSTIFD
jgi:hypothetical protein